MTVNTKRRYFADGYKNTPVFLVYKSVDNTVSSEGPFKNFEDAEIVLLDFLVSGVCAWVVSYNERER